MKVWVATDSVVSPLGITSQENFDHLLQEVSGISAIHDPTLSPRPLFAAQLKNFSPAPDSTRLETISRQAIAAAKTPLPLPADRTLFILSTTKGNIDWLGKKPPLTARLQLHQVAKAMASEAGLAHSLVVSNACISGVLAIIVARRFLRTGKFDHALLVGVDILSPFVVSGFQSLSALSDEPCRPFDVLRKGINLGEAAAALVLTTKPEELGVTPIINISGGGVSNDANHISGPSRTGEELALAIQEALDEGGAQAGDIDFISAHGTATLFNDEMESKAFGLAGLNTVPLNSLKGYFGHTLGAAGVVETAMSIQSLLHDTVPATKGFATLGVSGHLDVTRKRINAPLTMCLKTASGFGGCNAAILLKKENNS
jgi:3-oxoacyl-[acyl-carrier-protein] synthase-1